MIGNGVLKAQAAEPSIGEIDLNVTADLAFRADRKDITDNQHPDHQFRINRRPTEGAVKWRKFPVNPTRIQHRVNASNQVVRRDNLIKAELVEKLLLASCLPPHHRPISTAVASKKRNHCSHKIATDFCNTICTERQCCWPPFPSAVEGKAAAQGPGIGRVLLTLAA